MLMGLKGIRKLHKDIVILGETALFVSDIEF